MPHKYVQVEGVATFLHHRGPTTLPEAPPDTHRGRPVVCLHDAGGNGAHFDPVLDALAERHSPLAFDQPGHARSGGLDALGSVERLARFALGLVHKLGIGSAVWLGEGLGAAIALEIAAIDPAAVQALVLVAPPEPGAVDPGRLAALQTVVRGRARREFDPSGFAPGTAREVFARAFGEWLKTDPRVLLGDLRALRAWEPGTSPARLERPALAVVGEAASASHRDAAAALAGRLAGARVETLPGAARHPVLERPRELAACVAGFLDELGPEGAS